MLQFLFRDFTACCSEKRENEIKEKNNHNSTSYPRIDLLHLRSCLKKLLEQTGTAPLLPRQAASRSSSLVFCRSRNLQLQFFFSVAAAPSLSFLGNTTNRRKARFWVRPASHRTNVFSSFYSPSVTITSLLQCLK